MNKHLLRCGAALAVLASGSAQAQCSESKLAPWRVKLVKSGGGWDWQPKRKCPGA